MVMELVVSPDAYGWNDRWSKTLLDLSKAKRLASLPFV
jgi:hypothetical protein